MSDIAERVKAGFVITLIALLISAVPAWFTHIFVCLSDEKWGFLIAGAIMFPIGVIHGWGIWLGLF